MGIAGNTSSSMGPAGLPQVTRLLPGPVARGGEARGGCGRASPLPLAGSRRRKGAVILFINSNLPLEH